MGRSKPWIILLMSSSGAQADSLSRMAAWNPWHHGRASISPFGLRAWIGANRCGAVERTLLMSLWRSATAEIAANSGVPPWLNASASIASSGQIQLGAHRHRAGHDRGDIAVERGKTRGDGTLLGASLQ